MPPKISVITPVYKAEQYLRRCIESIQAQTLTDWELLLIDDGSPDNSGLLCDNYATRDQRIKVYHKENGGVASAREFGMQHALGEYSVHVDPDDWIEPDTLKVIYEKATAEDSDMVVFDLMMEFENRQEVYSQRADVISAHGYFLQLANQDLHGSLCCRLIRSDLYKRYNVHFPIGMDCWEDLYVCCLLLLNPIKVSYIPQAFYHYDLHSNSGSLTHKTNLKGLKSQMRCVELLQNQLPKERICELDESKWMVLLTAFRCRLLSEEEIRALYPEIHNHYIMKYGTRWGLPMYYGLCCLLRGDSYKKVKTKMAATGLLVRVKRKILGDGERQIY